MAIMLNFVLEVYENFFFSASQLPDSSILSRRAGIAGRAPAIPARPEIARQTDRIRRPDGRNRVEIALWSGTSRHWRELPDGRRQLSSACHDRTPGGGTTISTIMSARSSPQNGLPAG